MIEATSPSLRRWGSYEHNDCKRLGNAEPKQVDGGPCQQNKSIPISMLHLATNALLSLRALWEIKHIHYEHSEHSYSTVGGSHKLHDL